jgi:predicted house-cleaning noncanonical NTP pyrophosphatase (MazG superfamily)
MKSEEWSKIAERKFAWLDTEEGKEWFEEFALEQEKKESFSERWRDKFVSFLKDKTDEELSILFEVFHKHARKRREILYAQAIDGETDLYQYLLDAFEELGVEADEDAYGMFTSVVFDWRGYRMELYCGQGSFCSLSKI